MTTLAARRGYYLRMDRQVLCECGLPATHQVRVTQLRMLWAGACWKEMVQAMPLCDDCYALFLEEEKDNSTRRR